MVPEKSHIRVSVPAGCDQAALSRHIAELVLALDGYLEAEGVPGRCSLESDERGILIIFPCGAENPDMVRAAYQITKGLDRMNFETSWNARPPRRWWQFWKRKKGGP